MIIKPPGNNYDLQINEIYIKVLGSKIENNTISYSGKLLLNGEEINIPESVKNKIVIMDRSKENIKLNETDTVGTVLRVYNSENLSMCELPFLIDECLLLVFNINNDSCNIITYMKE